MDKLSWIHGKHIFGFWGEYNRPNFNKVGTQFSHGCSRYLKKQRKILEAMIVSLLVVSPHPVCSDGLTDGGCGKSVSRGAQGQPVFSQVLSSNG